MQGNKHYRGDIRNKMAQKTGNKQEESVEKHIGNCPKCGRTFSAVTANKLEILLAIHKYSKRCGQKIDLWLKGEKW